MGQTTSKGYQLKVVLATGGFDPIHRGHIAYLRAAKQLGDILIVGLNSNAWLERKMAEHLCHGMNANQWLIT